jgi:uncharacterized protein YigE (DUF2233 family)
MIKYLLLILLLALNLPFGGQVTAPAWAEEGLKNPNDCKALVFEDTSFTDCIATPGTHSIQMQIKGRDGIIYRGFPSLAREVDISTVAFAMNGGMYDAKSRPIGYYVEGGKKLHGLNSKDAAGNFYLKPNGVFFGTGHQWHVMASDAFDKTIAKRPDFGTQSGPMLVIDGMIHPKFDANGTSKYIRNAVGVDAEGHAHFVISDEPVSFGRMARMMRDVLKTPNALYLDGEVSALWNPAVGRMDGKYPLGPLILVTRHANGVP